MKVLVLATSYPSENSHDLMFIHVRNKYYQNNGIGVDVLNFNAKEDYIFDNVKVITKKTYDEKNEKYDILISHASNIRNHYRFIRKYGDRFKKIIYFYHGHEILKINENYPAEYSWVKKSFFKHLFQNLYDCFKLMVWRKKIVRSITKSELVFVSEWLYRRFLYYVHINPNKLEGHIHIINNSVGETFEKNSYKYNEKKEYDFITIRGNALDKSEHAIDIVNKLAIHNKSMRFLIVGSGHFYDYNEKPNNVTFINGYLKHDEMINYLNKSRCALLPTRQDTQGVMTCEMATFGIPTITSNIEVCQEIFSIFPNVKLIENGRAINLEPVLEELWENVPYKKVDKYFAKNTIQREIDLIKSE